MTDGKEGKEGEDKLGRIRIAQKRLKMERRQ